MISTRPWTWFSGVDAGRRLAVLTVFLVNLLIILGIWVVGLGKIDSFGNIALAISHLAALVGTYLILIQLLLLARIDVLERAFGKDGLIRIHRLNGYVAFYAILAHVLLLTIGYSFIYNVAYVPQFVDFVKNYEDVLQAVIALVLLCLVVGLSIAAARRVLKYELWYLVHLTAYLMVLLAFGHQIAVGPVFVTHPWLARYWVLLYALTFGIIAVYRFATPLYNYWQHRFVVAKVQCESADTVSIYITGRNLAKFKYDAGQFANWYFLGHRQWWQGHPFSFSTAPNGKYLRITVKALGNFTETIDSVKLGSPVIIDGPNGRFTPRIRTGRRIALIAGGVGIAPIRSIAEELGREGVTSMQLIYASRTEAGAVLRSELDPLARKYDMTISYVYSRDPNYPRRRIDLELLEQLMPDLPEREIYLCGPSSMMNELRIALKNLGVPEQMIHSEDFQL